MRMSALFRVFSSLMTEYHIFPVFVKRLLIILANYLHESTQRYVIVPQICHIQCPSACVVKPRGGNALLWVVQQVDSSNLLVVEIREIWHRDIASYTDRKYNYFP